MMCMIDGGYSGFRQPPLSNVAKMTRETWWARWYMVRMRDLGYLEMHIAGGSSLRIGVCQECGCREHHHALPDRIGSTSRPCLSVDRSGRRAVFCGCPTFRGKSSA